MVTSTLFTTLCAAIGDRKVRPPDGGEMGRLWTMRWLGENEKSWLFADNGDYVILYRTVDDQSPVQRVKVESPAHLTELLKEIS